MKIFINRKIRNVSFVLMALHALALMHTPGGGWSHNPKEPGFWIAIWSAVSSTMIVNWLLLKFSGKS